MTVAGRTDAPTGPDRSWPTRAAFLADLAGGLRAAEREALSLRRLLLGAVPCAVGTAAVLSVSAVGDSAVGQATCALALVLSVLAAVAVARGGQRARRALRRWEALERQLRHLPRGDLPADLRTPFDARHDDDLAEVGRRALGAEHARALDPRLLVRGLASGLGLTVGLTLLLLGVLGDPVSVAERAALLTGGVLGLLAGGHVATTATAHGWRSTRAWRRLGTEVDRWTALQALAAGRPPQPRTSGRPARALALLATPFVLLVGARLASASPATVVVTAAALAVVAGSLVRPWATAHLRGRRLRRGGEGALVQVDSEESLLTSTPDGLRFGARPLPDVVAATTGRRGSPTGAVVVDLLHADRTWTTVETREPQRLDAVLSAAGLPRY